MDLLSSILKILCPVNLVNSTRPGGDKYFFFAPGVVFVKVIDSIFFDSNLSLNVRRWHWRGRLSDIGHYCKLAIQLTRSIDH